MKRGPGKTEEESKKPHPLKFYMTFQVFLSSIPSPLLRKISLTSLNLSQQSPSPNLSANLINWQPPQYVTYNLFALSLWKILWSSELEYRFLEPNFLIQVLTSPDSNSEFSDKSLILPVSDSCISQLFLIVGFTAASLVLWRINCFPSVLSYFLQNGSAVGKSKIWYILSLNIAACFLRNTCLNAYFRQMCAIIYNIQPHLSV